MAQLEPTKGGYYLWKYLPSVPAGVIFCLLFIVVTLLITWRMYRTRTWFVTAFAIGCLFEVIGYGTRASAHYKTGKLMPYILQSVVILVAPALFAASIYMCLGRIIRRTKGEQYSAIRSTLLTKIFVFGDVFSFLVQSSGAGMMVSGDKAKLGERIVIAGLLIQVIMFGLFATVAVLFHVRMRRASSLGCDNFDIPWERGLHMLYAVSILIMTRSVYRVIEYAMGHDGYLLTHEWTLYVFDATLMLGTSVIFYIWYPSWIQPAADRNGYTMSGRQ